MSADRPSPYTVPEPTVEFTSAEQPPPRSMTVKQLIANLIGFADFYEAATADIERAEPCERPYAVGMRDSNAGHHQREFRATADIGRVRSHCLAEYGGELTITTARRLLGDLVRLPGLPVEAAEGMTLGAAMDRLTPPAGGASDAGGCSTFGDLVRDLDRGRFEQGSMPAAVRREVSRLELACNRLYGDALTPGTARRLRARLVDQHHLTYDTVDHIDLQAAADLLSGFRRVTAEEFHAAAAGQYHQGLHDYDHICLDGFNQEVVRVTGLSAKVVPGTTPTACPDARPAMPPSMLPTALDAVRRRNRLPAGTTIHWVGHDTGLRNRCRCHPDAPFAAPFDAPRWATVPAPTAETPTPSTVDTATTPPPSSPASVEPPAPAAGAVPDAVQPDGFIGVNDLRVRGVEVRFGRANYQRRLMVALWNDGDCRPHAPRQAEDVIAEVYGEDNETGDDAFRQLLSDTRRRLQAANFPLTISSAGGKVGLIDV